MNFSSIFFSFILFIGILPIAHAQISFTDANPDSLNIIYLSSEEEARAVSQKASALFVKNNMIAFIGALRPHTVLSEDQMTSLEQKLVNEAPMWFSYLGKALEVVKVKEEKIADFMLRETYLVRMEQSVMRLRYTYYKSNNGWVLNAFIVDEEYKEYFKDVEFK